MSQIKWLFERLCNSYSMSQTGYLRGCVTATLTHADMSQIEWLFVRLCNSYSMSQIGYLRGCVTATLTRADESDRMAICEAV